MSHRDEHERGHDAFNDRDFEALTANMSDDAVWVDHARGLEMKGKGQITEWLKGWVAAFSDARVSDVQYIDADDYSIATFTAQGKNDGAVAGLPGKGKTMRVQFCEILRYDGEGKMTHAESFYDQATIMRQLGLLEAEPTAKPRAAAQREPDVRPH